MATINSIRSFYETVEWLYEPEYGDFKRKLSLYIYRLESLLAPQISQEGLDLIEEMKRLCLYQPSGEIEQTRTEILQLSERLQKLYGHEKNTKDPA